IIKIIIYPLKKEVFLQPLSNWKELLNYFSGTDLKIKRLQVANLYFNEKFANKNLDNLKKDLKKLKDVEVISGYFTNEENKVWGEIDILKKIQPLGFEMNGWVYFVENNDLEINIDLNRYLDNSKNFSLSIGKGFIDPVPRLKALAQLKLKDKVVDFVVDFAKLEMLHLIFSKTKIDYERCLDHYSDNYSRIIDSFKSFLSIRKAQFSAEPDFIMSDLFEKLVLINFVKNHSLLEKITIIPVKYELKKVGFNYGVNNKLPSFYAGKKIIIGLFNGKFSYVEFQGKSEAKIRRFVSQETEKIHLEIKKMLGLDKLVYEDDDSSHISDDASDSNSDSGDEFQE
ncbi:hypothetical protein ACFLZV_06740, partial [Candidatus Margulisiibacteriota bacterium]